MTTRSAHHQIRAKSRRLVDERRCRPSAQHDAFHRAVGGSEALGRLRDLFLLVRGDFGVDFRRRDIEPACHRGAHEGQRGFDHAAIRSVESAGQSMESASLRDCSAPAEPS